MNVLAIVQKCSHKFILELVDYHYFMIINRCIYNTDIKKNKKKKYDILYFRTENSPYKTKPNATLLSFDCSIRIFQCSITIVQC